MTLVAERLAAMTDDLVDAHGIGDAQRREIFRRMAAILLRNRERRAVPGPT